MGRVHHNREDALHSANRELEKVQFLFENLQHVIYHTVEVRLAFGYHFARVFDVRANLRENKLRINFTVSLGKCIAKLRGNKLTTWFLNCNIGSFDDVINMSRDWGISTNTILFHLFDKIGFCEIPGRLSHVFSYPCRINLDLISYFYVWNFLISVSLPRHHCHKTKCK